MGRLTGKTAIITGASSGIGAGAAKAFAREGAAVLMAARRTDRLEKVAKAINAAGGKAIVIKTDVTSEADVQAMFALADKEFGHVDILVNNAGITDDTNCEKLSFEKWRRIVDTNLNSVFLCSREALRRMKPRKSGKIINVGSISGRVPRDDCPAYTATKFAVNGLTHSLALEGRPHGVTASVIMPGATVSELAGNSEERPPSAGVMAVETVADIIVTMAAVPNETNFFQAFVLPIAQPFLARG